MFRSAVDPLKEPNVRDAALEQLQWRLVDPLCERFTREGLDRPRLRAELAVAAFVGIVLCRHGGTLGELAGADPDELVPLVLDMLGQGS